MSYLDHFLKESSVTRQLRDSITSEEGNLDDNQTLSVASSKTNLSDMNMVIMKSFFFRFIDTSPVILFHFFQVYIYEILICALQYLSQS